eukprot:TRINITY_DN29239_c0_g1_i1.p1 TRINITY_DN29239_c0_g1~~TRINITY_DN29239_c0_g1_i1.p1  ORF type:complete len:336 (-),score=72.20 TRINITY_DN29239_c0_g1_i1:3-1010(-)
MAAAARTATPRVAASVLLLRPRRDFAMHPRSREDYEVLMMERSDKFGSFKGAMVFPGGVVEASDRSPGWAQLLELSQEPRERSRQELKISAIRELFEEAGVLLATPFGRLSSEAAKAHRARIRDASSEFEQMCRQERLAPAIKRLTMIQNWVTPAFVPKRFDTYFFLSIATDAGEAAAMTTEEADGSEAVRLQWAPPSGFLQLFEEQQLSFLPPQYYQLSILAGTPKLSDVEHLQAACDEAAVIPWTPERLSNEEGPGMCYPGDALHWQQRGPAATSRHRMYMRPVARLQGSSVAKALQVVNAQGSAVVYELERNTPVVFGAESWGGNRANASKL